MTKFQTKLFSSVLIFIMLFGLFSLAIFILSPLPSQAQTNFQPQIGVGNFKAGGTYPISNDTGTIAKYIRDIYSYAIGIVGILATAVMMFGGVLWLTAGGNPSRIGEAKTWITASLTGLLLTLTSYMILATVNPALVDFSRDIQSISTVQEYKNGCCKYSDRAAYEELSICSKNSGIFYENRILRSGDCVEPKNPGCCVISYKSGTIFSTDYTKCFPNTEKNTCLLSGGLYSIPPDATNLKFSHDISDPGCNNYRSSFLGLQACDNL